MTRSVLAGLVLVGGLLASGCSDSPGCDDVDSLTEQVDEADPEDPEYNELVNKLKQAEADCNSGY